MKCRVPSLEFVDLGVLDKFQLMFNKLSQDGSSKGNIERAADGRVVGVVYSLESGDLDALNRAEGLNHGYVNRTDWKVTHLNGEDWDERVFVYVAEGRYIVPDLLPYGWYMRHIIEGAHHHALPLPYIRELISRPAAEDPDTLRNAAERLFPCSRELTKDECSQVDSLKRRNGHLSDYAKHFRAKNPS
jgi:hypothetical protein